MKTVSIASGTSAAIFAVLTNIGYAQTGWHPATQGDKSIATPGATSGELKTPRPSQSSTSGMSGAAASDPGIAPHRHTRSVHDVHKRSKKMQ